MSIYEIWQAIINFELTELAMPAVFLMLIIAYYATKSDEEPASQDNGLLLLVKLRGFQESLSSKIWS